MKAKSGCIQKICHKICRFLFLASFALWVGRARAELSPGSSLTISPLKTSAAKSDFFLIKYNDSDPTPESGQLLLVKKGSQRVSILRVMKVSSSKKEFVGKELKKLNSPGLRVGDVYTASASSHSSASSDKVENDSNGKATEKATEKSSATYSKEPIPRFQFTPTLGFATVNYSETLSVAGATPTSVQMKEVNINVNLVYHFNTHWQISGDGGGTVIPFGSNVQGTTARFLTFDLDGAYTFGNRNGFYASLIFGWCYQTTLVTSTNSTGTFGYKNVSTLQAYPKVFFTLNPKNFLYAYAAFSPVFNGLSPLGLFSADEILVGLGWQHGPPQGGQVYLSLDYTNLGFNLAETSTSNLAISESKIALNAGFTF